MVQPIELTLSNRYFWKISPQIHSHLNKICFLFFFLDQINILIEDLGLTAVRSSNVSRLTQSEKQRLCVACQLLTDACVLILDQVTSNMDIFDTFFLVEYLRQWSSNGRMVIMTLQPPTFEILSMCSGVLLLSGGRTIYSGSRSDLPRYMGSVGMKIILL